MDTLGDRLKGIEVDSGTRWFLTTVKLYDAKGKRINDVSVKAFGIQWEAGEETKATLTLTTGEVYDMTVAFTAYDSDSGAPFGVRGVVLSYSKREGD